MTVKSVRDPASSAFRELDVLMRFNGESVQDVGDLDRALASVVDERAMVQVMRDEEVRTCPYPSDLWIEARQAREQGRSSRGPPIRLTPDVRACRDWRGRLLTAMAKTARTRSSG